MKISEAQSLLSAIVRDYSLNVRHQWSSCIMTQQLRLFLLVDSRYERHVVSGESQFVVKRIKVGARMVPLLHLVSQNSGSLIPITKAKLSPQAQPTITRAGVLAAMREAVDYQIKLFRSQQKKKRQMLLLELRYAELKEAVTCPLTGTPMSGSGAKLHVDHYDKPFIQLADEFLESLSLNNYLDLAEKLRYQKVILRPEIEKAWQKFHQANAKLQLVNGKANVKKGSSGYKSKY